MFTHILHHFRCKQYFSRVTSDTVEKEQSGCSYTASQISDQKKKQVPLTVFRSHIQQHVSNGDFQASL